MVTIDDIIEDYAQLGPSAFALTTLQLKHFNLAQTQKFNNKKIKIRGTVLDIKDDEIIASMSIKVSSRSINGIEMCFPPIFFYYTIPTSSQSLPNLLTIYINQCIDVEGIIASINRLADPDNRSDSICAIAILPQKIDKVNSEDNGQC